MKKKKSTIITTLALGFVVLFISIATVVNGAEGTANPTATGVSSGTFTIDNPLKATNFAQFLNDLLSIIVKIGVPILVLMTIYTGYQFVAARGNEGKLTAAKKSAVGLLIGAFIVLGAFAISQAITNTVQQLLPAGSSGITLPSVN